MHKCGIRPFTICYHQALKAAVSGNAIAISHMRVTAAEQPKCAATEDSHAHTAWQEIQRLATIEICVPYMTLVNKASNNIWFNKYQMKILILRLYRQKVPTGLASQTTRVSRHCYNSRTTKSTQYLSASRI